MTDDAKLIIALEDCQNADPDTATEIIVTASAKLHGVNVDVLRTYWLEKLCACALAKQRL